MKNSVCSFFAMSLALIAGTIHPAHARSNPCDRNVFESSNQNFVQINSMIEEQVNYLERHLLGILGYADKTARSPIASLTPLEDGYYTMIKNKNFDALNLSFLGTSLEIIETLTKSIDSLKLSQMELMGRLKSTGENLSSFFAYSRNCISHIMIGATMNSTTAPEEVQIFVSLAKEEGLRVKFSLQRLNALQNAVLSVEAYLNKKPQQQQPVSE